MEIRTDSRLYRVAYWWRRQLDGHPPSRTNLCRFFWSVIVGVTIGPIVVAVVWFLIVLIASLCAVFGFFFGYRPNIWDESGKYGDRYYYEDNFMIPIQSLPIWRGTQVKPIYLICTGIALWASWWVTSWFVSSGAWRSALSWLLIACGVSILAALAYQFFRSEAWTLTKAFLKAKKQGVCPVITFTEPEAETVAAEQ